MKLTAEMLPQIRVCRGLSHAEFSFYMRFPVSFRFRDRKTHITKYYENKIWYALESLHISSKELEHIYKLVQIKNNKQNTKVEL